MGGRGRGGYDYPANDGVNESCVMSGPPVDDASASLTDVAASQRFELIINIFLFKNSFYDGRIFTILECNNLLSRYHTNAFPCIRFCQIPRRQHKINDNWINHLK